MINKTLNELSDNLKSGEISSVELCSSYLEHISDIDKKINSFLKLEPERILKAAEESDCRRKNKSLLSPFDGIPIGIKDNIMSEGETCSCASKILNSFKSTYDATVVKKLKSSGLIPFGRLNMDEFAMGSSCEKSAYMSTSNPWDTERVPGGSSGASAAAVSARMIPVSLGSDTGGSIRQPASFCGAVGLKPSYGRVSRYGLVAFASSLDQIGPLSVNISDSATMLDIISGHDSMDCTSIPEKSANFAESIQKTAYKDIKGLKIGLPKEYYELKGLKSSVKSVIDEMIEKLSDAGAEFLEISLPHTQYAIATYYIIATAEASANLARFDGIRYGYRSNEAEDLMQTYFKSRGDGFGEEVKRRILLGTYVLSSGYYDAYYLRAQKVRTLIRKDLNEAFEKCDIILTPTSPSTAFRQGEKSDPLQMYLSDIYTISANLAGNCALSMPAGLDDKGLPVGMQLMAPSMQEAKLLKTGKTFELVRKEKYFIPEV